MVIPSGVPAIRIYRDGRCLDAAQTVTLLYELIFLKLAFVCAD